MVLTIGKSSPDDIIRIMGAPTKTQNSPNNTKTLTFSLTGRALKVFVDKGSRDHDYVIMMNQKDQIQAVFNRGVLVSLSKIIPGPKNPPRRKR
jgi:hypothetical protein